MEHIIFPIKINGNFFNNLITFHLAGFAEMNKKLKM